MCVRWCGWVHGPLQSMEEGSGSGKAGMEKGCTAQQEDYAHPGTNSDVHIDFPCYLQSAAVPLLVSRGS